MNVLEKLIDKFPVFDPAWPAESQGAWFAAYERLLSFSSIAAHISEQPATPATPAAEVTETPPPEVERKPAPADRAKNYVRKVSNEQRVEIRRLAALGMTNKTIAEELGTPLAATTLYATEGRRAQREESGADLHSAGFPANGRDL